MKKKLWLLLLVICAVVVFSACQKNEEITEFAIKNDELRVAIGQTYNLQDCFEKAGDGKVYYTVENSDVMTVDGGILTGLKEGSGFVYLNAGDFFGRISVEIYDPYKLDIKLDSESFTYDGTVKNLILSGVPADCKVSYFVDGEEFFGTSLPGRYKVTATVDLPEKYTVVSFKNEGILTINRIRLNIDVKFPSATYVYDGEEKSINIQGELPKEVTVKVENNIATDAGMYGAKATFFVDETYYEPIKPLTATLTILKKDYDIDFSTVTSGNVVYNGKEQFMTVTPSKGLGVEYYVYDAKERNFLKKSEYMAKYAEIEPFKNVGNYRVKISFYALNGYEKNYAVPAEREYYLNITKADFVSTLAWKQSENSYDAIYDGVAKRIGYGEGYDAGIVGKTCGLNGEYPEGAKIEFFCNKNTAIKESLAFTDAGSYNITAVITMPVGSEKNYNPLSNMTYRYVIKKADYYDGLIFDGISEGVSYKDKKIVYDGVGHIFKVTFDDEAKGQKFLNEVNISYYIERNGVESTFDGYAVIKNAGTYKVGYKLSFREGVSDEEKEYIKSLKNNYTLPKDYCFDTEITKKEIKIDGISFPDKSYVFDGTEHMVEIIGSLPENLFAVYQNNVFTNAGTYKASVSFLVSGDNISNFYLTRNGTVVSTLNANIVISKANYNREEVEEPIVGGDVYDKNRNLASYALPKNYRWYTPTTVPTCGQTLYEVVYNADPQNYNDLTRIYATLVISPKEIDLAGISISSRFLPYTGKAVFPTASGVGGEYLEVFATAEDDAIGYGRHGFTDISVSPIDDNYLLIGEKTFDDVVIFVYNGNVFDYSGMTLIKYKGMANEVTVPEGTESIHRDAFLDKSRITVLYLPDSIKSLSGGLNGLSGLKEVFLPFVGKTADSEGLDGRFSSVFNYGTITKVTVTNSDTIKRGAFYGCNGITEIEYVKKVISIGESAFHDCSSIKKLSFEDLETLGKFAFLGCTGLKELSLPFYTVDSGTISDLFGTNASDGAVDNSYSLYNIEVLNFASGSFSKVDSYAFANLSSLKKIILPYTVTSVGYGAFSGIKGEIVFDKDGVETEGNFNKISSGMFYGYAGTSIKIPATVTEIGNEGFGNAFYLTELVLPEGLTAIGESAFKNVYAKITFTGDKYTSVGSKTFSDYAGNTVSLPKSVTEIKSFAFLGAKIKTIVLSGVTLAGSNIFEGCTYLTTADIDAPTLPSGTFLNCTALKTVAIKNISEIGANAFKGCKNLKEFTIPDTVTRIGDGAFADCAIASDINECVFVFNGNLPTFGNNVFTKGVKIKVYVKKELVNAFFEVLKQNYPNMEFYPLS